MISFLMPVILCLTVAAAVALGVFATYAAVITILHAFSNKPQHVAAAPRLVLVPSQSQASGD